MDSNNVTIVITIKTSSINGQQSEAEIDAFTARVVGAAELRLSKSILTISVDKHRQVTGPIVL